MGAALGEAEARAKESLWAVLGAYLQRHVGESSVVLDLACDRGYFIRNIRAVDRWATDVRDVSAELPKDVRFVQADSLELETALPIGHFDRVFISNFLEHLPGPDVVVRQLEVVHRLLRSNGRVIILQPNIRLARGSYWDFIDHRVAQTERAFKRRPNSPQPGASKTPTPPGAAGIMNERPTATTTSGPAKTGK